jgi:hypothetical protein
VTCGSITTSGPIKTGLDAWDVDELIELAQDLPIEEIAHESIGETDSNYGGLFGSIFARPRIPPGRHLF